MKYCFYLWLSLLPLSLQAEPSPNPYAENGIGPRYRIADVYKDADLVAVGQVIGKTPNGTDLRLKINQIVKGNAGGEIILRGQMPMGTEWNGFSLPEKTDCLLLLRKVGDLYERVDGFNNAGPTYYEVKNGRVILAPQGGHYEEALEIPLGRIRKYFQSNPAPLWLQ